MPVKFERKLRREAEEKFKYIKNPTLRADRMDAYVYGTLRKAGWKPKRER